MAKIPTAVVIVDGDDWVGVYRDGKLIREGHLSPSGIKASYEDKKRGDMGISVSEIVPNLDWLMERGNLPALLSEVEVQKKNKARPSPSTLESLHIQVGDTFRLDQRWDYETLGLHGHHSSGEVLKILDPYRLRATFEDSWTDNFPPFKDHFKTTKVTIDIREHVLQDVEHVLDNAPSV